MQLEKINLSELIESEYNPREISKKELNTLSNNLQKFGLVDPIIINLKNNKIIGGHQRYAVIKDKYESKKQLNLLKLGDIGWVFDDTELVIEDENHEKALNLSLNKIQGTWDYIKLVDVLSDLNEDDFNVNLTGFDENELESFNIYKEPNMVPNNNLSGSNPSSLNEESVNNEPTDISQTTDVLSITIPNDEEDEEDDMPEEILIDIDVQKDLKTKFCCPKCKYEW